MAGISLPVMTEYDPANSAEGALDPLGLYSIADALATQLVPGVRERQSHPRYLTAMALGAILTRDFDRLAADGESEPWMVYEWHAVEGLVRTQGQNPALAGLPGIQKTKKAINDGVHLSAARYLKTATVFGFHGVYRVLAENLDIVRDEILGEAGYQLAMIWEKEQGLEGFVSSKQGNGSYYRESLVNAINDGLNKGGVDRSNSWEGFKFFSQYLFPNQIPPKEAEFIAQRLIQNPESFRSQLIRFMSSKPGKAAWSDQENKSEKNFHKALRGQADANLISLLDAIESYELFSRLLQDAFEDCLHAMTRRHCQISPRELAEEKGCQKAFKRIPELFSEVADRISLFGQAPRFIEPFGSLAEKTSVESWVNILLDHHIKVQRQKPPNGKNPWFESYDDGSVAVRTGYRREQGGLYNDEYVHTYRCFPLWSFLFDLNILEK